MQKNLTQENLMKVLLRFSLPYLLSCFLQTFYGLADLFVIGQYNGADAISAVSIGSQVTHMITVMIVGLAMGTTVMIGRAVGAKKAELVTRAIGNTMVLFAVLAILATVFLSFAADGILTALSTPAEAVSQARSYLLICFAGIPFITAYNVISSIYRGLGDSRSPMCFVAIAGVINIVLDVVFIGPLKMAAAGAAYATIIAQAVSVVITLCALRRVDLGTAFRRRDLYPDRQMMGSVLKVGLPIAFQDGFIQISFLVITMIANQRGLVAAAGVGIVEKVISFLFLVPSAMLSSVSAIAAQNAGAGQHGRARRVLFYALAVCIAYGTVTAIACQIGAKPLLGLFVKETPQVVATGSQYLRAYVWDCIIAGVHFCFSGYFCAYGKSYLSFLHNLISVLALRIPLAYLASVTYPQTLYPMGLAAPAGSLFSVVFCVIVFLVMQKRGFGQKEGALL